MMNLLLSKRTEHEPPGKPGAHNLQYERYHFVNARRPSSSGVRASYLLRKDLSSDN